MISLNDKLGKKNGITSYVKEYYMPIFIVRTNLKMNGEYFITKHANSFDNVLNNISDETNVCTL
jgi:hypothetical protein